MFVRLKRLLVEAEAAMRSDINVKHDVKVNARLE